MKSELLVKYLIEVCNPEIFLRRPYLNSINTPRYLEYTFVTFVIMWLSAYE
jgi:hypothetical protein